MSFFKFVVTSLLLLTPTYSLPLEHRDGASSLVKFPPFIHPGILCDLPIPIVKKILCPRQGTPSLTVNTPLGTAHGAADGSDAIRFAVKYADVHRWQESSVVTSWSLPNGNTDPTALPKVCVQESVDSSVMSEDCLSMILYVPKSLKTNSKAPTMVWIHGGSFTMGSATAPGLDGSKLAAATNSMVAVIQYRLGVLGFFPPNGGTNLAVKDAINALRFLQKVVPSFGGDSSQITLAGQSAGASLIRALLATPSASSLFKSAILQSDTMDYGFLSTSSQQILQGYVSEQFECAGSDTGCLNSIPLDQIITAQENLEDAAKAGLDAAAGSVEPVRPTRDGSLITTSLTDSTPFPAVNKPLLVSTVRNEAGFTIFGGFSDGLSPSVYQGVVSSAFGSDVAALLLKNINYAIPPSDIGNDRADVRSQLQTMGTDQVWRCPNWTFGRAWNKNGGKVYMGEYVVGATYPGNEDVHFCTQPGSVCHQDDIQIVFGTVPSPTAAQAKLTKEIQARYSAFLRTGNPNASGLANWAPASGDNVNALILGGSGEVPSGGCDPSFWGAVIPYDYQLFDI